MFQTIKNLIKSFFISIETKDPTETILELRKIKINNIKKATKYEMMKHIYPLLHYIRNSDIKQYYGRIDFEYRTVFEFNNLIVDVYRSIHKNYLIEVFVGKTKVCYTAQITNYGNKHSFELMTDLVTYDNLKEFIDLLLKRENEVLAQKYKINVEILNNLI